jgi:hypothetical protein
MDPTLLLKTTARTLLLTLLAAAPASADVLDLTDVFGVSFSASQSLWAGGPSAGLDASGRTNGSVGLYYEVRADTGTVDATQNGALSASYLSETALGSSTTIGLQFTGDPGGRVQSRFGASAETGIHMDISGCLLGRDPFFGTCLGAYNIDTDIAVIDEGFFLNPTTTHTPVIDAQRTAIDADQAAGVGAGPSLGPYSLGPSMNLDLEQQIWFTPTGLSGFACYENRDTLETGCSPFTVPTSGEAFLSLALGLGTWDIAFLQLSLLNTFRNDIDLELRPAFDYIVGSWPPVGQELFAFNLLDETFSLDFNEVARAGAISVSVVDRVQSVPEPAALLLFGTAVLTAVRRNRRGGRT